MITRLFWRTLDALDYFLTSARPEPETPADRQRERERERMRGAFPYVDLDGP